MTLPNYNSQYPIHSKAYLGANEQIQHMLTSDSTIIDLPVNKMGQHTPLFFALYGYAKLGTVKLLADHGANFSLKDNMGRYPIHLAANAARTDILEFVLKVNNGPETPLYISDNAKRNALHALCMPTSESKPSEEDFQASLRLILDNIPAEDRQEYMKLKDQDNNTAAMLAKKFRYDHLLPIFAEYGYDLSDVADVQIANDDSQDYYGRNNLHQYAFVGNTSKVHTLLQEKVANPDLQNPQMANRTPFLYACSGLGGAELVKEFIDQCSLGSLIVTDEFDGTALHYAAYNKPKIVELLINDPKVKDHYIKVINKPDADGLTPLHAALMKRANKEDIAATVRLLIENGADLSLQDKQGRSCIELASEYDNSELLEEYLPALCLSNSNEGIFLNALKRFTSAIGSLTTSASQEELVSVDADKQENETPEPNSSLKNNTMS